MMCFEAEQEVVCYDKYCMAWQKMVALALLILEGILSFESENYSSTRTY